jgi:hypothetical protein
MIMLLTLSSIFSSHIPGDFVKLQSEGNYCYANALFQCLNNFNEVSEYFKLDESFTSPFDFVLRDIFLTMESDRGDTVKLISQYNKLIGMINNKDLDIDSYNDPLEFFVFILGYRDRDASNIRLINSASNNINIKFNYLNRLFIYETMVFEDYILIVDGLSSVQTAVEDYFQDKILAVHPQILVVQFVINTQLINLSDQIDVQGVIYELNSYIVNENGDSRHYYSCLRNRDKIYVVDNTTISEERKINDNGGVYLAFYKKISE